MTPMPPTSAIATAMPASVTVSMGEETSGVRRLMFLVTCDVRSTSCAPKWMCRGRKMTSSYV